MKREREGKSKSPLFYDFAFCHTFMISKLSFMAFAVTLTLFFPEIANHGLCCYCLKEVESRRDILMMLINVRVSVKCFYFM